jgi:hypothetical protein
MMSKKCKRVKKEILKEYEKEQLKRAKEILEMENWEKWINGKWL